MRLRPLWIAVPACAAAGVFGVSMVGAQESAPRATAQPGGIRPDTRAAHSMFGPPPTAGNVRPASNSEPAAPPPLFFPNATPPKNDAMPTLPPGMAPPRITVESNAPSASNEPRTLPVKTSQMPVISPPLPTAEPSGPQTLVAKPAVMPQALPISVSNAMSFPTMQLMAKQSPNVMIEVQMPESISVGAPLEYTLIVKNGGSSAVANISVQDELPQGASYLSSEPAAEQQGERLAWTLGTLEANGEKRIRITVKPGEEGELRSRAMVSFTAAAEARVKVTRPRIAVALTGSDSARVGDEIPFQIKVTNTGSGPASNVLVKAKLSEGLHHPAGSQIEAMIDRLPPGDSKVITLRALATKSGGHGCSITTTGDGLVAEVASSNVSVVEPLLTARIAGPSRCNVRSEPEYRIELANPGTAATDPVQVWAVVPEGFEFVSASDNGNYQAANRTIIWNMPVLNANSNRSLALKLKAASASDAIVKVVAQTVPGNSDITSVAIGAKSNASRILEVKAEAAVKSEGVPALRFEVVDIEDPVEVGKEALYDIKIMNQGTGPCTNVVVNVALADGTTTAGATGPTTARGQGQQIAFDAMPVLAAKGEATYRVRVKGLQAGDMKLRVQLTCDEIRTPTAKEENTRFFKD